MNTINWNEVLIIAMPFLIFASKIIDQILGTLNIVYTVKGNKFLATLISILEITVYLLAFSKIMENMNNWILITSYIGGFAVGTWVGIWVEEKLSVGYVKIKIMSKKKTDSLLAYLKRHKYNITSNYMASVDNKKVNSLSVICSRKECSLVLEMLDKHDKNAFYSIEDIREVNQINFNKAKTVKSEKSIETR